MESKSAASKAAQAEVVENLLETLDQPTTAEQKLAAIAQYRQTILAMRRQSPTASPSASPVQIKKLDADWLVQLPADHRERLVERRLTLKEIQQALSSTAGGNAVLWQKLLLVIQRHRQRTAALPQPSITPKVVVPELADQMQAVEALKAGLASTDLSQRQQAVLTYQQTMRELSQQDHERPVQITHPRPSPIQTDLNSPTP